MNSPALSPLNGDTSPPLLSGNNSWQARASIETRRYSIAVAATSFAFLARWSMQPWLGDHCVFSFFYLSVVFTAWLAGTGPAVVAIFLGAVVAFQFLVSTPGCFVIDSISDVMQLSIFVLVNCTATILFSRLERLRRIAEARSVENEQLSQSLQIADGRKDNFLALLAHELRNPLAPLRCSLALLDRKGPATESGQSGEDYHRSESQSESENDATVIQRVKGIIERQTTHLIRLTDDLLDISRFCRGKVDLRLDTMDLRDAINDALEMTESKISEQSLTFNSVIPNAPVWLKGDRIRLTQMVANLLGNAIKYTPAGGRVTLQVESSSLTGRATITVSDNGIGFPPSQKQQILEPFMQVDTSRTRDYGGLGLGLSIVNRLTSLHGGELDAFSRGPGMGSRFTVTLPLTIAPKKAISEPERRQEELMSWSSEAAAVQDGGFEGGCVDTSEFMLADFLSEGISNPDSSPGDEPFSETFQEQETLCGSVLDTINCEPQRESESLSTSIQRDGCRMLMVEDNADSAHLMGELFEFDGYEVDLAHEGITALQMATDGAYDLIILDIGLPGMDGYEVARRIRSMAEIRQPKLIALTGWGGPDDRRRSQEAGFDLHLVKPIDFSELIDHVEKQLAFKDDSHQLA